MPQRCGKCKRYTRQDENLATISIPGWGSGMVCLPCVAEATHEDYHPRVWSIDEQDTLPIKPNSDGVIDICGVCRTALFWRETNTPMRLAPEDVQGASIVPGCYASCPRCIGHFRPLILLRLQSVGELPSAMTERQMPLNYLL